MNWNILVALGKEIKRDSMISENESRKAYKYYQNIPKVYGYILN